MPNSSTTKLTKLSQKVASAAAPTTILIISGVYLLLYQAQPLGELGSTPCLAMNQNCSSSTRCCPPSTCQVHGSGSDTICIAGPLVTSTAAARNSSAYKPTPPPAVPLLKCPYATGAASRVEQILQPLRDGPEFNQTVAYLGARKQDYIRKSAYRGDRTRNFYLTIRDIDLLLHDNYQDMIRRIGNNIYPLIVASEVEPDSATGVGGTFTLYLEDGSSKRIRPTSPMYEMYKNLAHMPLAVFTIVSPYFLTSEARSWRHGMRALQEKVEDAIAAVTVADADSAPLQISESVQQHVLKMLTITNGYIAHWLNQSRAVSIDDFEAYTSEIFPLVEYNIKNAAQLQVQALLPRLLEWREELGERWKDVYAVIPTVWPVAGINTRMQVLAQLMSPEQVRSQVMLLENAGGLAEQRATLGRIVGDRAAAALILGRNTAAKERLTFALSTRQDLISNACADAIEAFSKGVRVQE